VAIDSSGSRQIIPVTSAQKPYAGTALTAVLAGTAYRWVSRLERYLAGMRPVSQDNQQIIKSGQVTIPYSHNIRPFTHITQARYIFSGAPAIKAT